MQYLSFLAPIAFVFALAALAQTGSLKKKVDEMNKEIEALKQEKQSTK